MKRSTQLAGVLLAAFWALTAAAQLKTKNILLITTDGLRWQEVMTGADPGLLNKENGGVQNIPAIKKAYLRNTPEERRAALMPFFWSVIAKRGQVYGNQTKASVAHITNTMKFSYPGYNEILCGFRDPTITSNDPIPNKNVTVLEWLNRKPAFAGNVAVFSGWSVMPFIINRERAGFTVFGGPESLPEKNPNPTQQLLNDLIKETAGTGDNETTDPFVFHAALDYLINHKPRIFYVTFGETDSDGHAGRYDRILDDAHRVDSYVEKLWETIQSMDEYRDQTTLIFTTDHGRGLAPTEWKSHGKDIKGAENIWMAFMGPDTPALGERANIDPVTQNQIAATLAALMGDDYHAAVPESGEAIQDVLPKRH